MKGGYYKPENIHDACCENKRSNDREALLVALGSAREQQRERHKKLESRQHEGDPLPAARAAVQIPPDFSRQIPGPDDEELRKRDVGPENDKREEQIAEVVKMFGGERGRERFVMRECSGERGHERQGREELAGH